MRTLNEIHAKRVAALKGSLAELKEKTESSGSSNEDIRDAFDALLLQSLSTFILWKTDLRTRELVTHLNIDKRLEEIQTLRNGLFTNKMPRDRLLATVKVYVRHATTLIDQFEEDVLPLFGIHHERASGFPIPPFPSESELKEAIKRWEKSRWEFKAREAFPFWDIGLDDQIRAHHTREFARDVASLANTKDGGYLVFGVIDPKNLRPGQDQVQEFRISESQVRDAEQVVRSRVRPVPEFDIESVLLEGKHVTIVAVAEGENELCDVDFITYIRGLAGRREALPDDKARLNERRRQKRSTLSGKASGTAASQERKSLEAEWKVDGLMEGRPEFDSGQFQQAYFETVILPLQGKPRTISVSAENLELVQQLFSWCTSAKVTVRRHGFSIEPPDFGLIEDPVMRQRRRESYLDEGSPTGSISESGIVQFSAAQRRWTSGSPTVDLLLLRFTIGLSLFSAACLLDLFEYSGSCRWELRLKSVKGYPATFWRSQDVHQVLLPGPYHFKHDHDPFPFRYTIAGPGLLEQSIRAFAGFWSEVLLELEYVAKEDAVWEDLESTVSAQLRQIGVPEQTAVTLYNTAKEKGLLLHE